MRTALLFILLMNMLQAAHAAPVQLQRIHRLDSGDKIQIYFSFDTVPLFTEQASERRLDLLLPDTTLSPAATLFAPDEHIVKILPREEGTTLVLSLYFRYRPQKYTIRPSGNNRLVMEVLPGNEYSRAHQELAERLKGLSLLDRSAVDQTNPLRQSPYARNWQLFFAGYESPLEINVPIDFTLPPFPLIRLLPPSTEANLALLSPELIALAEAKNWAQVESELLHLVEHSTDLEERKLLALTLGEVLVRRGAVDSAVNQLQTIQHNYNQELLGSYATFLLLQLHASKGNPHLAVVEYADLEKAIVPSSPLAPYLLLARIETALVTGNLSLVNSLLQHIDIALPTDVAEIIQLYQANYWAAIGQPVKAHAAYQLHANSAALASHPYSRNGHCASLYFMREYHSAEQCYQGLASLVAAKEPLGLIVYRQHMARRHQNSQSADIDIFSRIENAFAGSEAGLRARMKRTDLEFLNQPDRIGRVLDSYQQIAATTINRYLREEALFKVALVHRHLEDYGQAIHTVEEILREFRSGPVRISAQALMIELLPGEIRRLIEVGEYLPALVLVRKNRELFLNGWIKGDLLMEIAETYHRLGFFDEAQRIYLYIIEVTPADRRDLYYLPMIAAASEQGSWSLVDDYAAQYTYNHPEGQDRDRILLFRLQALAAMGQVEEGLRILPDPLPAVDGFHQIAASLFFRGERYAQALDLFEKMRELSLSLTVLEQFMLAESLYQLGAYQQAEGVFAGLAGDHPFYDQSTFRRAEIARIEGNREMALSLLQKIVETGKSTSWRELAERELRYAALIDNLQ